MNIYKSINSETDNHNAELIGIENSTKKISFFDFNNNINNKKNNTVKDLSNICKNQKKSLVKSESKVDIDSKSLIKSVQSGIKFKKLITKSESSAGFYNNN